MGSRPTPEEDLSDEALVRRARDGDEGAARALFDRHAARLRARVRARLPAVLKRKVGDSDVVQEAYLTAFLRLCDFEDRGEGSFSRWLSRILEHKVRDEVRRHCGTDMRAARREVAPTDASAAPREPSAAGPSPSSSLVRRETRTQLRAHLDELPESYATILRMVHRQHLSLRELARLTSKSEAAVRQTYHRALKAFRERAERRRTSGDR